MRWLDFLIVYVNCVCSLNAIKYQLSILVFISSYATRISSPSNKIHFQYMKMAVARAKADDYCMCVCVCECGRAQSISYQKLFVTVVYTSISMDQKQNSPFSPVMDVCKERVVCVHPSFLLFQFVALVDTSGLWHLIRKLNSHLPT